jgi:phenylpropionate dioxygenase-like ring-hydroxylating dioxygenase large terminal subunit
MSTVLTNESPGLARAWHPVMRAVDLGNEPVRVQLIGDPWVIVRLNGQISAFLDRCPHRNARLSDGTVVDSTLQCAYHGWRFGQTGACALIPALGAGATTPPTADLAPIRVQVKYDLIWIAPQEPLCDILPIAAWDDPTLTKVWMPPIVFGASAAQFIDNFLDITHFPFIHLGTFGTKDDETIDGFDLAKDTDPWGFTLLRDHMIANKMDPKVDTGEHPLVQPRSMRYDFRAPFTSALQLHLTMTGMRNVIASFCQPIDMNTSCLYQVMIRNDVHSDDDYARAIAFQTAVFDEDLKIIEYLYDKAIPLSGGQTHTKADRNTVEFRRIMSKLLAAT